MNTAPLAKTIEVIFDANGIGSDVKIDGVSLPWAIGRQLDIHYRDGSLGFVTITIPAERIFTREAE